MKKYIGCDVGGTNVRAAIVDVETGSIIHQMSMPTLARDGPEALMRRMGGLFLQIIEWAGLKKDDIGGIGIGVPGMIDLEKGETLFLPNLPGNWRHISVAETITSLTGLPTVLLNDARSITNGEWRFGAGRGGEGGGSGPGNSPAAVGGGSGYGTAVRGR